MNWTAVVLAYGASKDFKRCYDKALQVLQGKRKQDFMPQAYEAKKSLDVALEKSYLFISEKDFMEQYKVCPKKAGFKVDTIVDEHKTPVTGVLVKDPGQRHPRLVVRASIGTTLADQLLIPSDQVRPNQGIAMSTWWEADLLKEHAHGANASLTEEGILEKIEAYKAQCLEEEQRKEAEKMAVLASAEALQTEHQAGEAMQSESESEAEQAYGIVLPSQQAAAASAKGKGKGRGKKKKKKNKDEGVLSSSSATLAVASEVKPV